MLVLSTLLSLAVQDPIRPRYDEVTLTGNDTSLAASVRAPEVANGSVTSPPALAPGERLVASLADADRTFVLVGVMERAPDHGFHVDWRTGAAGYRLRAERRGEVLWQRDLPLGGARDGEPAGLLTPPRPDGSTEALEGLALLGGFLLVTPGARDDLRLVDRDSGEDVRRIERLWEFRRGFVGPSMWTHFIARFGNQRLRGTWSDQSDEQRAALLASERAAFEQRVAASLLAGPVVVGDRAFVLVARAPRDPWSRNLGTAVVYELNLGLQIVTTGVLPDLPLPGAHVVHGDGVVWATANQGLVRLARTEQPRGGRGPGGPDLTPDVRWSRRLPAAQHGGWLEADPASQAVVFADGVAWRPVGGGWVARPGGPYHFPLARVDLESGDVQVLTLSVPFDGALPRPGTNYRSDGATIHVLGPYHLGLSGLSLDGGLLELRLAHGGGQQALVFDVSRLDG